MRSIMELIRPELSELSALNLEKFAIFDFVYILDSTNINQSAPNLVKMYVTISDHKISDEIGYGFNRTRTV